MKDVKICLSIGAMDPQFRQMQQTLSGYAQVDVTGLGDFSLKGYDIFIGKKLDTEILATADRLRAVFAYKTGVDDFPLAQLGEKGVVLVNSHVDAGYIAEYAIGLSMSLLHRITESDNKLRRGIWRDRADPYWKSFFSAKIGLVGYGHIGRMIHSYLHHNHIETYTIDRGGRYPEDIHLVSSLEQLCRQTDLLILSLPKTPETDGMFDAEMLQLLRGKYIVNVGRSNCIDQKALYEALSGNILAGAAIDTWDRKPANMLDTLIPYAYPFDRLDNIVLSPHQAMQVADGHERYVTDITEKVIRYIQTGALSDVVDLTKGY